METLGALRYNILYASNNLMGLGKYVPFLSVTAECADRYSDAVLVGGGSDQYVADIGDETTPLWTGTASTDIQHAISQGLFTIGSLQGKIIDEDQANTMNSELNLFGMSFLPWDKYSIQNIQGQYVYMHGWADDGDKRMINPLRRDVLMTKVFTVAKVAGASALVYYGGKYAYKKLKL